MEIQLLRDARIWHKAGETVDVSPAECRFLVSTGSAVLIEEAAKEAKPKAKKK